MGKDGDNSDAEIADDCAESDNFGVPKQLGSLDEFYDGPKSPLDLLLLLHTTTTKPATTMVELKMLRYINGSLSSNS